MIAKLHLDKIAEALVFGGGVGMAMQGKLGWVAVLSGLGKLLPSGSFRTLILWLASKMPADPVKV